MVDSERHSYCRGIEFRRGKTDLENFTQASGKGSAVSRKELDHPAVGDVVAIEFRRVFKEINIIRNFGPEKPVLMLGQTELDEISKCRGEAVDKLFWLEPTPNILIADIMSCTGASNEPIAPRPGKFIGLSQSPETMEFDILDIYEPEGSYPGTDRDYLEEVRGQLRDGLVYQYAIARVLVMISAGEEVRY